jgi:hypothetical protein
MLLWCNITIQAYYYGQKQNVSIYSNSDGVVIYKMNSILCLSSYIRA